MKKLKSGFFQAIWSIIIGFIITAAVQLCVKEGWVPAYSTVILSAFNIIANIFTLRKVRGWGIFYTLGWLAGSFIFKEVGLLETIDFIFNIIAPICLLFVRLLIWIRDSSHKMVSKRSKSTN